MENVLCPFHRSEEETAVVHLFSKSTIARTLWFDKWEIHSEEVSACSGVEWVSKVQNDHSWMPNHTPQQDLFIFLQLYQWIVSGNATIPQSLKPKWLIWVNFLRRY
ncbi:unnamed protein product [Camellia sinensis]